VRPEEREQLLAAFALGTLSEPDGAVVRDLVRSDPAAADELAGYHEIVDMIALSAPLRRTDPTLRSRVLAAARKDRTRQTRRLDPRRWLPWVAAAAAITLLLAWGWNLQGTLDQVQRDNSVLTAVVEAEAKRLQSLFETETDVSSQALQLQVQSATSEIELALAVTTAPDVRSSILQSTAAGHGARGHFLWSEDTGAGWLTANDLPQLGLGLVYEVWLLDSRQTISGGTFLPDDAGRVESLVLPLTTLRPSRIVIAVSPQGGADNPGATRVLEGFVLR
jgi:anti-sigma factor RsiW